MSDSNGDRSLRIFEIVVATLLGLGALGGAWAGYQANQWGSSAIENFGKSSTTATRGAALYNQGVATANRDANLDIHGKELTLQLGKPGLNAASVRLRIRGLCGGLRRFDALGALAAFVA